MINDKKVKAIYNSNNDNYERLSQIHDVDVETVKKIKQGKVPYQKALTKKLKKEFSNIRTKNLGDNIMEISFK